MNILIAASEASPFAKTGGLGDVCGALPTELAKLGHEVTLILPAYRQVFDAGQTIEPTEIEIEVPVGSQQIRGRLLRSTLPCGTVPVYFIEQADYFDRDGLYGEGGEDYKDNAQRFVFFCRGVIEAIRQLDLKVDVLHTNDWQTGLIPAYLKLAYAGVPPLEQIRTLMTVHNLAYQGSFWHWDMLLTGLDWKHFNWQEMEFFGNLNLMKTGLVYADKINTVSPRYAEEIQAPPLSCGLEGVLRHRSADLSGIINGVDYTQWNPATDEHIEANYDADDFAEGKAKCKAALQAEMGLPVEADVPVIGFVGRLAEQKGIDLVADVARDWVETSQVQWALLGTGEAKYHELFAQLAERYPDKVTVQLAFSNPSAHRIEAGADMFVMPSRYEPCGLNQLYSLKYGTVPVVRATGGLADTITNASEASLAAGTANGFSFEPYEKIALSEALGRAVAVYHDRPLWNRLVEIGMRQDWSWARSAERYIELYEQCVAGAVCT
jgi:starch synthase